jgi:hypothetical protein
MRGGRRDSHEDRSGNEIELGTTWNWRGDELKSFEGLKWNAEMYRRTQEESLTQPSVVLAMT